jgi:hypothetical protein
LYNRKHENYEQLCKFLKKIVLNYIEARPETEHCNDTFQKEKKQGGGRVVNRENSFSRTDIQPNTSLQLILCLNFSLAV